MPQISVNGHRCRYQLDGPDGAPVLVFSNALGSALEMWDAQLAELAPGLRLLRYDTRGQGRSEATPGPYSMTQLGRDVLDLTQALGIERFSFCGISMGGLIGQWLGLNAGDRLQRLVLCNTAARIGTAESWAARLEGLATSSMASVADGAIARWFTDGFATANPAVVQGIREQVATCDAAGYVANCAAIRDADFRANLADIRVPTLIVAGRHDAGTTVDDAMVLADGIPDSRVLVLDAAHLSNVAERQPFNAAILDFLHP